MPLKKAYNFFFPLLQPGSRVRLQDVTSVANRVTASYFFFLLVLHLERMLFGRVEMLFLWWVVFLGIVYNLVYVENVPIFFLNSFLFIILCMKKIIMLFT